jgi:hypothetical protein
MTLHEGEQMDQGEKLMTLQALSFSALRSHEEHKWRFWQRLFKKIMEARQQKAREYVAEYLRRHNEYQEK